MACCGVTLGPFPRGASPMRRAPPGWRSAGELPAGSSCGVACSPGECSPGCHCGPCTDLRRSAGALLVVTPERAAGDLLGGIRGARPPGGGARTTPGRVTVLDEEPVPGPGPGGAESFEDMDRSTWDAMTARERQAWLGRVAGDRRDREELVARGALGAFDTLRQILRDRQQAEIERLRLERGGGPPVRTGPPTTTTPPAAQKGSVATLALPLGLAALLLR